MIRCATAFCLLATPAPAQEMEVIGTVEATIDGVEISLWVPYLPEEDESYAFLSGSGVVAVLSVDAFSGTPGEALENPRLSLGLMRPGLQAVATGIHLYRAGESDRMYKAERSEGTFRIGAVSVEGQTIEFEFEATALATDMATFEPVADAAPIEIEGRVEVTLRDE